MSERIKASHILVKTEEEALKIKESIEKGEIDFPHAAGQYSLCPSGGDGGDLGYFPKGVMVKAFEDAAFSAELNKVTDPVQTQFGWHLILVTDKD
ncbi:MAG: peptidyl-prolyl cis-trans isomerase [Candidatus Gastranaerophilales bacterium]|nr:peptidyl-prolyl cis-trans isomerase [Candidatus Gastranaerophilales bacterium]